MSHLSDITILQLLTDILQNKFEQNVLPSENDLCEQYAVSRTTLRSALEVLEAKMVITKSPKRKTIINDVTTWDWFDPFVLGVLKDNIDHKELLSHIYFLRLTFEPQVSALAALNSTLEDLSELLDCFNQMKQGLEEHNLSLFKAGDVGIHSVIFKSAHNPFCEKLRNLIVNVSSISIDSTAETTEEELKKALDAHAELIEAIRLKDALKVQSLVVDLLLDSIHKTFAKQLPAYVSLFKANR